MAEKTTNRFKGHWKTLVFLGLATVAIGGLGWWVADSMGDLATYLSSAIGTAAGGMVAVWAAFFFWVNDKHDTREQRTLEESRAAAKRIQDRAMTIRSSARLASAGDQIAIHDVVDKCAWMKSQLTLISDAQLRKDLDDAIDMMDPYSDMDYYSGGIGLTQRVWPVVSWIGEMVGQYVHDDGRTVKRPEHYERLLDAVVYKRGKEAADIEFLENEAAEEAAKSADSEDASKPSDTHTSDSKKMA